MNFSKAFVLLAFNFLSILVFAQSEIYNSATSTNNLNSSLSTNQAPYFDLALFKEIIDGANDLSTEEFMTAEPDIYYENAGDGERVAVDVSRYSQKSQTGQEERISLTAQRLTDFLMSSNFAFNDQITHSILRNAQLYVEIIRDRRTNLKYLFGGNPLATQITDPKFGVDIIPNANFIRALMRVQAAALKDIAETAQKVLNVMAYSDRNTSSDAAIIYHHCIMAAAVGVNNSNCVKDNNIQLSKDKEAIARFERAYMISYRISRLAFPRFHHQIKLIGDHTIIQQGVELTMNLVKNADSLQYTTGGVLESQYKEMTIFKVPEIESWRECDELRAHHKSIKDIFNSQLGCTTGKINLGPFGAIDTCFRQHSEENRRKVSVPSLGLEFASVFFERPGYRRDVQDDFGFKTLRLNLICPVDKTYHYNIN